MGRKQKLKQQRKLEKLTGRRQAGRQKKWWLIYGSLAALLIIAGAIVLWAKNNQPTTSDNPANQPDLSNNSQNSLDSINPLAEMSTASDNPTAIIKTVRGNIMIELFPQNAPQTVSNFIKLAQDGFYDGTAFHRVVPDFVIQGGDPLSKDSNPGNDGTGGPGYTFADEINPWSLGLSDQQISNLEAQGYQYTKDLTSLPNRVGALAMANAGPNTNGSQFFIITTKDQPGLNGKHAVFGQVISGLDITRKIQAGDKIEKITVNQ